MIGPGLARFLVVRAGFRRLRGSLALRGLKAGLLIVARKAEICGRFLRDLAIVRAASNGGVDACIGKTLASLMRFPSHDSLLNLHVVI